MLESDFLIKLLRIDVKSMQSAEVNKIALEQTQALAGDCGRILVWHTRTEKPKDKDEMKLRKIGQGSPDMEVSSNIHPRC